jgi:ankyrin repeat protein
LAYSIAYGFLDVGALLLNAGAIKGRDEFLVAAARQGRIPLVRVLLARGIDVNTKVDHDTTAIAEAAAHGEIDMVEFLLSVGANANVKDVDGETPLMAAAAFGDLRTVEAIIRSGADREAVDIHGRTAWNHAVRNGHAAIAKLLEGTSVHE